MYNCVMKSYGMLMRLVGVISVLCSSLIVNLHMNESLVYNPYSQVNYPIMKVRTDTWKE